MEGNFFGNGRQEIFNKDKNYDAFIKLVQKAAARN